MTKKMSEKKDLNRFLYRMLPAFFVLLVVALVGMLRLGRAEDEADVIVIAVPYSELVQDYETNYYTAWLEERTGYDITFVGLDEGYEGEALNILLTSAYSNVDAVFLPEDQKILSRGEYRNYIESGCLAAPRDYLGEDSNLMRLASEYPQADYSGLLGEDGRAYCFPSVNMARTAQNMQILWINVDWLTNLNLQMPRTTEEFTAVLRRFLEDDPNGNGVRDELPLVSCEAASPFQSYRYLLNAFVYYDTEHLGVTEGGEAILWGDGWERLRSGLAYCAMLYGDGLLAGDSFFYTGKQLMELVNNPADTVGAFSSHSIADVVYTNNPEVLAHFVQLAPLSSEILERGYAVKTGIFPNIGGLIPANSAHKEAAARIMDLMLSREASLIALYGEEDEDWRFSKNGELSTYGTRAMVTTIRYLKGEKQNKNYAGAGPLLASAEYADGVTWNGDHSMTEYIDARAVKTYEVYYNPDDDGGVRDAAGGGEENSVKTRRTEYLEAGVLAFITGERAIADDGEWARFIAGYERQGQE